MPDSVDVSNGIAAQAHEQVTRGKYQGTRAVSPRLLESKSKVPSLRSERRSSAISGRKRPRSRGVLRTGPRTGPAFQHTSLDFGHYGLVVGVDFVNMLCEIWKDSVAMVHMIRESVVELTIEPGRAKW